MLPSGTAGTSWSLSYKVENCSLKPSLGWVKKKSTNPAVLLTCRSETKVTVDVFTDWCVPLRTLSFAAEFGCGMRFSITFKSRGNNTDFKTFLLLESVYLTQKKQRFKLCFITYVSWFTVGFNDLKDLFQLK